MIMNVKQVRIWKKEVIIYSRYDSIVHFYRMSTIT